MEEDTVFEQPTKETFSYINTRVNNQIAYFEKNAINNQTFYKFLKSTAIFCNVFVTMTIALSFTVPDDLKVYMGIIALILSTIVLGTFQWEEFQNYGAKWEKFRLIAEQLKSEKHLFENGAGRYASVSENETKKVFVATVENVIKGSDISISSLTVEPGKRAETRIQHIFDTSSGF